MAERCPIFNMGFTVPTMATPTLTLSPDLDLLQDLDMSNDEEFFFMDGSELVPGEGNINTFSPLATEVDQAQACRCMCAQLAPPEAGSAYTSLAGHLSPIQTTRPLAIQSPCWRDSLTMEGPESRVPLPASMPQTIARPMDTPSIAVSQWPQHVSHSAVDHTFDATYHSSYPTFDYDMPMEAPSNSFQSTTLSETPWSEVQGFPYLGWPEGDFNSSLTAPSSFELPTYHLSNPASLSMPLVTNAPVQSQDELDRTDDARQVEQLFEKRRLPSAPLPDANVSTLASWAKGTYNVSDRTNFGKLARPGAPPPGLKKRRAIPSRAGSSASLSCQGCGKTFASKSEKDHHARWHGPKTQVCAVCGKGFIALKDLRRHERIHRPTEHAYFCDHLGCVYGTRGFARKDHLLRHQKTHGVAIGPLDVVAEYSASF